MVQKAVVQFRRDALWQRMLIGDKIDDGGRRKHKSDVDEAKDLVIIFIIQCLKLDYSLKNYCNK